MFLSAYCAALLFTLFFFLLNIGTNFFSSPSTMVEPMFIKSIEVSSFRSSSSFFKLFVFRFSLSICSCFPTFCRVSVRTFCASIFHPSFVLLISFLLYMLSSSKRMFLYFGKFGRSHIRPYPSLQI